MKTFKLITFFAFLCLAGVLVSCSSNDDDFIEPSNFTRDLPEPSSSVYLQTDFTTQRVDIIADSGCSENTVLHEHQGSGESELFGKFNVEMSFCIDPSTNYHSNLNATLENEAGEVIYIQSKDETPIETTDPVEFLNPNDKDTGEKVDIGITEISYEATGGTGRFAKATGTLIASGVVTFNSSNINISLFGNINLNN